MPVAVLTPQQGFLKIGKEAVARGTAAATMESLDADSRTLKARPTRIKPRSMNNSVHEHLEIAKGRQEGGGDISGRVRVDTIGHLLMGVFGTDTIAGAADPWTHTFSVASSIPSYTIEKNVGGLTGASNSEQYLNAVVQRLVISGEPEGDDSVVMFTASLVGKAPTKITATAYTKPTMAVIPAALATFQYNGATTADVLTSWQFAFERIVQLPKGANNSLDISDAVGTVFRVSGFIEAYFLNWGQFYDDFMANAERSISVKTALSASRSLELIVTDGYFDDMDHDEGSEVVKQRLNFDAIFNATDGGAAKAVLLNARSTAY